MYKQSAGLIGILKGMSAANSAEQSHKPSPDNSTEAVPSTEGKSQETVILADRQIGQKMTKDCVQPHPSSSHEAGCSNVKSPGTKEKRVLPEFEFSQNLQKSSKVTDQGSKGINQCKDQESVPTNMAENDWPITKAINDMQEQLKVITASLAHVAPTFNEMKTAHDDWKKFQDESEDFNDSEDEIAPPLKRVKLVQTDDTVINSSQPSAGQAGVRSSMTSDTADSAVPSTSSTTSGTDPESHQGMSLPAKSKQTDGQHNSALDYLAGNVNKKEVVGEKIDDQLATVVTDLLQMGMNKEIREKMMEEIHKPENCKRLDVVLVNTGIFNNVNRETKSEDLSLQHIQKPLTKGLTQLVYLMNNLIKAEKYESETPSRQDILSFLSKSFSLLAESSHEIDLRRRKNFKSELKEEYKPLCADSNPVTELLFGSDLGKDAKELDNIDDIGVVKEQEVQEHVKPIF